MSKTLGDEIAEYQKSMEHPWLWKLENTVDTVFVPMIRERIKTLMGNRSDGIVTYMKIEGNTIARALGKFRYQIKLEDLNQLVDFLSKKHQVYCAPSYNSSSNDFWITVYFNNKAVKA